MKTNVSVAVNQLLECFPVLISETMLVNMIDPCVFRQYDINCNAHRLLSLKLRLISE